MPALVAGIHVLGNAKKKDMDGRVKPGHDGGMFCPNLGPAERLEGDDGVGVLDARNDLYLFIHEVADIGALIDIELHQQVVMPRGGVDLRGDLGLRQRIGNDIGLAELAFDLDEKGHHRCRLREVIEAQYSVVKLAGNNTPR